MTHTNTPEREAEGKNITRGRQAFDMLVASYRSRDLHAVADGLDYETMHNGWPQQACLAAEVAAIEETLRLRDMATCERDAAIARAEQAEALLRVHHDHHLQVGTIGLPDGNGGWIEIDNGAEYSDSGLYERTERILSNLPEELKPMPRGGINANHWSDAIMLRRELKAARKRITELEGMTQADREAEALEEVKRLSGLKSHYTERQDQ